MPVFKVNPCSAPRMTQRDKWEKRKCVLKYHAYRDELRLRARIAKFELSDRFSVDFYIEMPKSWSKVKRGLKVNTPHDVKTRLDLDNLLKGLMDSLLEDDGSVHEIHARKWWAEDGAIRLENLEASQSITGDYGKTSQT